MSMRKTLVNKRNNPLLGVFCFCYFVVNVLGFQPIHLREFVFAIYLKI